MKFNMGCGRRKLDGWVNVDAWPGCEPDAVWDLETTPWPWPDDCASEILFNHSLEHLGAEVKVFLAIVQEIYRIAAPGCTIRINVPHPKHDFFANDPTHVRGISPPMMQMFDKQACDRWAETGVANTPLAHHLSVDLALTQQRIILDEPYLSQWRSGEATTADINRWLSERWNVASEIRMVFTARKPYGAAGGASAETPT